MQDDVMQQWIAELRNLVAQRNDVPVLSHMASIVPEYQPSYKWQTAMGRNQMKAAAVGA